MTNESDTLDLILTRLGNKFGWYQLKNYFFISLPVIFCAMFTLSYVFTARNLNYRCHIAECDTDNEFNYKPVWLQEAVPFKEEEPSRCQRYSSTQFNQTTEHISENSTCPSQFFNQSNTERCDKFVYSTQDVTILNDFGLTCEENMWKLTLVGSVNNLGEFIVQPVGGFISDRYGRKFRMLSGILISIIVGLSRSVAPSYIWFLLFEFLDTALGSGVFACGFILGMELVSPEKRILSSAIISSAYSIGEACLALLAMYISNWRHLLRIIYTPAALLLVLYWFMPESLRWMLAKGKTAEVKEILRKGAKLNKIEMPEELLEKLNQTEDKQEVLTEDYPIGQIFKSRRFLIRLATCSFCWITCAFVFFGLTLNSVAVSGNLYINFIFVGLVEIPAFVTMCLIGDKMGRRTMLSLSLLLSGAACITFIFISEDSTIIKLITFMTGKFGITIAYTVIYVFTAELFPTSIRHSMVGTCSMFARIGSMTAPQMPLLGEIFKALPLLLFGGMCCAAGFLVLTLPETLNTKLPDTIEEAENIDRTTKTYDEDSETP